MSETAAVQIDRPPATIVRKHVKKTRLARSRAWLGILLLSPFAAAAVFSTPPVEPGSLAALAWLSAGWIMFFAGAGWRIWGTLYLGGRKGDVLVAEGPYSVCRNPIYLGTVLMTLSAGLMLASLTLIAGTALAAIVYLWLTVPAEEHRLASHLGESYLDYRRRVPRLWPRWSGFRSAATIEVSVKGLAAEARRAARWVWLPLIYQAFAMLRAESWWPQWWSAP